MDIENLRNDEKFVIGQFDTSLWSSLVDCMTVRKKDDIGVTFKDGTIIHIK